MLRRAAMRVAEGETGPIAISAADLQTVLGAPTFEDEVAMRVSVPGVATGLAWTPVGGDILFIEATAIPGNNRLILTGQLGEVMRESAQAALSIVKNRAAELGMIPLVSKGPTSISMCRRERRRRTAQALAWRCSWRLPRS